MSLSTLVSHLTDGSGTPLKPSDILKSEGKRQALELLLDACGSVLVGRQREVLTLTMGLCGQVPISQSELAGTLELSRERVRAISQQGLKRLLKAAREGKADAGVSDSLELTVFEGDGVQRAQSWSRLPDAELRRRAMQAANERDAETLWGLTEAYLTLYSSKRSRVSPKTLRAYRQGVWRLLEFWGDENLLRPSRDAGARYIVGLETTPYRKDKLGQPVYYKPATVNLMLAAARALYRALRWAKATSENPFEDVRPVPDPVPPERKVAAYSEEDVARLLEQAAPVDAVFVLLCAHGGLRVEEATTLTWGQVDLEAGGMTVIGKGRKEDWVPFSDDLLGALESFHEEQSPDTQVLPFGTDRARDRLKRLCLESGVLYTGRGVHGLRHHAGTRMWEIYGSIDAPADHLRHANVQTTRRYTKKTRERRREMARKLTVKREP